MFSPHAPQDYATHLRATMDQILHNNDAASPDNKLFQVASYALANNGKMQRGCMLIEVCQILKGNEEGALFAGAALEYLHLGTLVHDDIIDGDELRRGKPAVWRQYDRDLALLSGDQFYFLAFQALAQALRHIPAGPSVRILETFSTASINLCLGQVLEEKLVGNCAARHDDYLDVVRLKTASLFRATLEIGALIGGGSEELIQALGQFAEHLGIAFQIIDDLLPFTSDAQTTGKPVTSDIRNHRLTIPVLYALQAASASDQQTLRAIFEQGQFDTRLEEAHQILQTLCVQTGAFEKAEQEAWSRYNQAMPLLQVLPPGAGRDHLTQMANQMVQRNR